MSVIKTYSTVKIDEKLSGKANSNHKQAYTASECTSYTDDSNCGVTAAAVKKAFSVFEPKAHGHAIGNVTGLQDALNSKASVSHNHDNNYLGKHLHYDYFSHANLGSKFVNYKDFCQRFGFASTTGSYGFSYGRNQLSSDLMSQYGATIAFQDYDGLAYIDISRQALPYVGFACSNGNFHHYRIPIWNDLTWNNISGKPTTFDPSNHTHSWNDIYSKPSEFTPSPHKHQIADINFLQSELDRIPSLQQIATWNTFINQYPTDLKNLTNKVNLKQDKLTSGSTIKTINNQTLLGSGNINISANVPTASQSTAGIYKVMTYSPVSTSNWYADDIVLSGKALKYISEQLKWGSSSSSSYPTKTGHLGAYATADADKHKQIKLADLTGGTKGRFYYIWGTEKCEYGILSVQKTTTFYRDYDCLAMSSNDHGYWSASELFVSIYVPPNTTYYLWGTNIKNVYARWFE